MFENWVADQKDDMELAKNHAYIVGSFFDPERAKKLLGDSGNTHTSSDEDMEKSMEMVRRGSIFGDEKVEQQDEGNKKKKRARKKLSLLKD
jgi:RecA/RadA recombinase